ncbi:hypothetical protein M413DRAFT_445083 [Hebeloma cylindrosporum]|uniref:Mitochondrial inner membrane protein OXA1L n=1 Tax=Hebeloma cylindrosporum TaxID=76867 RepID=A0A0C2YLG5_HEBCY|nr:hypothetical protein M413DRAFT_445083 [Hebeloma cylindrosporum h7]
MESLSESTSAAVATSEPTTMEPTTLVDPGFTNDLISTEPNFTVSTATSAPATLQYGDLADNGFVDGFVEGVFCRTFELINVSTGLPWFWTIIAGSAFWELLCVPASIYTMKRIAQLESHRPNITAMQAALRDARRNNALTEEAKMGICLEDYYRKHDVEEMKPYRRLDNVISIPVRFYLFLGVAKLCTIEQLTHSGFSLFPDLTVPDSTFVLPILVAAVSDSCIRALIRNMNFKDNVYSRAHATNILRLYGIPLIILASKLDIGVCLSCITVGLLIRARLFLMGTPAVRLYFGLPVIAGKDRRRVPDIRTSFKLLSQVVKVKQP